LAATRGEIEMVAPVFHFYAGAVDKHDGGTMPVAGGVEMRLRKALGVVARPPLGLPAQDRLVEARPALVCGNTAVLRPAELPISRGRLVELAVEAGVPRRGRPAVARRRRGAAGSA